MMSDKLLGALKEHFTKLNGIASRRLEEAVQVHTRCLQRTSAAAVELKKNLGEAGDGKAKISSTLQFHQANLETSRSEFTEMEAEIPLTAMLKAMQQEHADILEKISEPGMPARKDHVVQIYRHFLLPQYLLRLAELVREIRKEVSESLSVLMKDEFIPPGEIRWKERFDGMLGGFFEGQREEFGHLLVRAAKPLSFTGLRIRLKKGTLRDAFSQVSHMERSWRTTFYAFYEDWRFREYLLCYIQEIRLLQLEVTSIFSSRIRTTLVPELDRQKAFVNTILKGLPDPDKVSMEELRSFLVKELYKMNKEQKQHVQDHRSAFEAAESIPGILQKLESGIEEKMEAFPQKVGVVYTPDYQKGIRPSEIRYFSPREFLEFSSLAAFLEISKQLKDDLGKLLQKIIREFREFDQIVDFYIDSGIILTQKPGVKEEEVIVTFREGLNRLEAITEHSKAMLGDLEHKKWLEVSSNTEAFIDSVNQLDNNDNILNIYTRILKSRAMASSAKNRERLASGMKNAIGWTGRFASKHFSWLRASYEDIRKRLKLTSTSAIITSEISSYLAGIRNRITELPVIYQHLFEPAPVKELNLFLSREEDSGKLNHAFSQWEKGNFAATLVTGEEGSGCSSLLLHFGQTLKSQYQILMFQVDRFYFSEQDFYNLIGEIFNQPGIKDEDSLKSYISTLTEKIVIIDGLERMFMRKVNGFECLRRFLSLVVDTNERIFWICSVSKFAYHYLNRTAALSEHFDYILDIDNLHKDDIREIIMKRNRLSGYDLTFLGSAEESRDNSELSQEELELAFFSDLDRFAGSNIALSLIYWLQSVQSVGEEGIQVGKFRVPDFEFLENLPANKTFALLLVVLHGKITESYHAEVSNCSLMESSGLLSILREDAILVRKEGYFHLNGILYRHVIKLLKDRNLIH